MIYAFTDPEGFAKAEWEEAQVVSLNSMAKLATLGIIVLGLGHKLARHCCCPGAGTPPWSSRDDNIDDTPEIDLPALKLKE